MQEEDERQEKECEEKDRERYSLNKAAKDCYSQQQGDSGA